MKLEKILNLIFPKSNFFFDRSKKCYMSTKKTNLQCEKSILRHIVSVIILSMYIFWSKWQCMLFSDCTLIHFILIPMGDKGNHLDHCYYEDSKILALIEQILRCYKSF